MRKNIIPNADSMITVLLAVFVAFIMLVSYIVALSKFSNSHESVDTTSDISLEIDVSSDVSVEEDIPAVSIPVDGYEYYNKFTFENVELSNAEVSNGKLAIVKPNTASPSVPESDLVRIGVEKQGSYGLKDMSLKIKNEVMAELDQFLISFNEEVPSNSLIVGEGYLPKSSSVSENDTSIDLCTGYSVQFAIYGSNDSLSSSKYAYLYEQASKFGFVQRFPGNKINSTGFDIDYKTYRYVGVAHSSYMRHYNYCLEEYIDKIKTERVIERKPGNGVSDAYVVYYVPKAENSTTTSVSVPSDYEYEISGDGNDGFIITVTVPA